MMRHSPIVPGLIALLGITAVLCTHARARDPEVTSDTPAYCDVLMERITGMVHDASLPPSTEVAVLSQEGERMCVSGQIRGGVMRLRRAIAIMRHGED